MSKQHEEPVVSLGEMIEAPVHFKKPQRRYVLTMTVEGDTLSDVLMSLRTVGSEVTKGRIDMMVGGPDSGVYYRLREDPTMSHERYLEELQAWVDNQRKVVG